ncbi:MAG: hypothetical protein JRG91_15240 [Deltaproteobacteria bacterium]|nr:hypothetical protein [Deltaproteobacteria bacterium]
MHARAITVVLILALVALGCDESGLTGDATGDATGDTAHDTLPDTGSDPTDTGSDTTPPDVPHDAPDGLVLLSCYEIELAVNVDASPGESLVRWYGSFFPAEESLIVTNVSVSHLEFDHGGATRTFTGSHVDHGPLDELPGIQEEVKGTIEVTPGEVSDCVASGPSLSRGGGSDDVVVRMVGSSDQGEWSAECDMGPDDLILTCHSGLSMMAWGSAYMWEYPPPDAGWYVDAGAGIRIPEGTEVGTVTLHSAIVRGEGTEETFDISAAGAYDSTTSWMSAIAISYMQEGTLPEILCPDIETGYPVELYVTYEGTSDGGSFSGAAPANQCMTGEI